MLKITIFFALITAVLYAFFAAMFRNESQPKRQGQHIGAIFAIFFYFSIPLLLWRFGWRFTFKLFIFCIALDLVFVAILKHAWSLDELWQTFLLGQLILAPIRAIAGLWLSKRGEMYRVR